MARSLFKHKNFSTFICNQIHKVDAGKVVLLETFQFSFFQYNSDEYEADVELKVGYKNGETQEVCSLREEVFINHQL